MFKLNGPGDIMKCMAGFCQASPGGSLPVIFPRPDCRRLGSHGASWHPRRIVMSPGRWRRAAISHRPAGPRLALGPATVCASARVSERARASGVPVCVRVCVRACSESAGTKLPYPPKLSSPHTGGWRPNRPSFWFGAPCFRTERPQKSENGLNLDKSADFTKNR